MQPIKPINTENLLHGASKFSLYLIVRSWSHQLKELSISSLYYLLAQIHIKDRAYAENTMILMHLVLMPLHVAYTLVEILFITFLTTMDGIHHDIYISVRFSLS